MPDKTGDHMQAGEMILTGKLPAGEKLKAEKLRTLRDEGASSVR